MTEHGNGYMPGKQIHGFLNLNIPNDLALRYSRNFGPYGRTVFTPDGLEKCHQVSNFILFYFTSFRLWSAFFRYINSTKNIYITSNKFQVVVVTSH